MRLAYWLPLSMIATTLQMNWCNYYTYLTLEACLVGWHPTVTIFLTQENCWLLVQKIMRLIATITVTTPLTPMLADCCNYIANYMTNIVLALDDWPIPITTLDLSIPLIFPWTHILQPLLLLCCAPRSIGTANISNLVLVDFPDHPWPLIIILLFIQLITVPVTTLAPFLIAHCCHCSC
jgi:hypothetical protein